jgi:hypothetical protein
LPNLYNCAHCCGAVSVSEQRARAELWPHQEPDGLPPRGPSPPSGDLSFSLLTPQFPGVPVARWTLDPPHVRKSQVPSDVITSQKSTSNSAGSPVGSLAPPRATPRLGGVCVSCQYFPCSFVLALRELGLRLGVKVKAPLPLARASSRGVLPGAGALAG